MKKLKVQLTGLTPLMLDAFRGQEETPPEQKMYFAPDKKTLILPTSNIIGFLTSKKSHSCVRLFASNKEWSLRGLEILGNVYIDPMEIPLLADGKAVEFTGKWDDKIYLDERMCWPNKAVRMMVRRPVVSLPWSLNFTMTINETEFVTVNRMKDWFVRGGISVGVGAYRPLFGRFEAKFS